MDSTTQMHQRHSIAVGALPLPQCCNTKWVTPITITGTKCWVHQHANHHHNRAIYRQLAILCRKRHYQALVVKCKMLFFVWGSQEFMTAIRSSIFYSISGTQSALKCSSFHSYPAYWRPFAEKCVICCQLPRHLAKSG